MGLYVCCEKLLIGLRSGHRHLQYAAITTTYNTTAIRPCYDHSRVVVVFGPAKKNFLTPSLTTVQNLVAVSHTVCA